jgi:MoaA/NifB/PqqE/SkfB family radical SAM enzyme
MSVKIHENERQFVQPGLGTTKTKKGGELRSMWMEIPGWCDLYCPYCYAATRKVDQDPNNLNIQEYRNLISEFSNLGGKDIGIPGSGEPFYKDEQTGESNCDLILDILDYCKGLGICLTVFTTAHWIDNSLAERLFKYDVVLLVKYNSMKSSVQNKLVGNPHHLNYAEKRDHVLLNLMALGFNEPAYGKKSRLGIVTSVMNANKDELPTLLRFARRHNIIFDCDTILERGRGKSFDEQGGSPPDSEMREIFQKLQQIDAEEFGNYWHISRSYIGTCCDRFRHHLYVSKTGDVHPCVGATTVNLGHIRKSSLQECWNTPVMKIIREHKYEGKCAQCLNYIEEKCYSCLGRCTINLSDKEISKNGFVQTIGCWNHRPQ